MRELFEKNRGRIVHIHLAHENISGRIVAVAEEYVEIKENVDTAYVVYAHIILVRFVSERG